MRKRCHRRVTVPLPPRGLRPKLDRGQLTDLALAHIANLDALARGGANSTTLWHAVEAAFTWSRVAQLLGCGEAEMAEQLAVSREPMRRDVMQALGLASAILGRDPNATGIRNYLERLRAGERLTPAQRELVRTALPHVFDKEQST